MLPWSLESLGNKSRNLLRCGCTLEIFQWFSIRIFRETVRKTWKNMKNLQNVNICWIRDLRTWACQQRKHLYATAPLSVSSVQRHKDLLKSCRWVDVKSPKSEFCRFLHHESRIDLCRLHFISFDCGVVSVQVSEWRDHGGRKVPERHRGMDKN